MGVSRFKKGQFLACKFRDKGGKNGDLVLGLIESVRSNGKVVCQNLLTGGTSIKSVEVLDSRNTVISKRAADKVLRVFADGDKAAAREAAVVQATVSTGNGAVTVPEGIQAVWTLIDIRDHFMGLPDGDKTECAKQILPEVLKALGVEV